MTNRPTHHTHILPPNAKIWDYPTELVAIYKGYDPILRFRATIRLVYHKEEGPVEIVTLPDGRRGIRSLGSRPNSKKAKTLPRLLCRSHDPILPGWEAFQELVDKEQIRHNKAMQHQPSQIS